MIEESPVVPDRWATSPGGDYARVSHSLMRVSPCGSLWDEVKSHGM